MAKQKPDPFRLKATILVDGDTVVVAKADLSVLNRKGHLSPTKRQYRKIGTELARFLRSADG